MVDFRAPRRRLGVRERRAGWDEFADLAPNWSGIRYDRIEEQGIQWPCPAGTIRALASSTPPIRRCGRQGQVLPGRVPASDRAAGLGVPLRPLHRPHALSLQLGGDDDAGDGRDRQAAGTLLRDLGRGRVEPRARRWRSGAARLPSRLARGAGARDRSRLSGARMDGPPLRPGEGELASTTSATP